MRPIRGHTYRTEACQVTIETAAEQTEHQKKATFDGRRSGYRGKCACGHSFGFDLDGKALGGRFRHGERISAQDAAADLLEDVTPAMRLRTGYRYAFRNAEGHADITEIKPNGTAIGYKRIRDDFGIWASDTGNYDAFGKSVWGNPTDPDWRWDLVREIGPTPKAADPVTLAAACEAAGEAPQVPAFKLEVGKCYLFRNAPGYVKITGVSGKWPDKVNGQVFDGAAVLMISPEHWSWSSTGKHGTASRYDLVAERAPTVWKPAPHLVNQMMWLNKQPLRPFYGRTFPDMMIFDEATKFSDRLIKAGFTISGTKAKAPEKTRLQQFDEQNAAKLNTDRGKVYGHPKVDFGRVAKLKAVIAECKDPLVRHVLEMVAVKIARLIETPDHLDSWSDISGYSRTGVMVTEPERKVGMAPELAMGYTPGDSVGQKKAAE